MQAIQTGWETFIQKFPDPIARYNQDYKHLFINEAIEQEISKPASEVIGKSNRDLKIPNDEVFLSELERKIKRVFETGQPEVNYTQHEFPEETRFYYMKLIPDFYEQEELAKKVRSVWAITRDITPLKQTEINLKKAEKNLRQQNNELNQLNFDLDTFFHTVSHDMRGPLYNVKGLIAALKGAEPGEMPNLIQMLENSAQRIEDILTGLTDILEFKTKQELGELIQLEVVLQLILCEFQTAIRQTGAIIQADFSHCSAVHYARPYLESLFRNMISNALKYRCAARPLHLQITAKEENSYVSLSFQDNGQGIDLERNGQKIFKPFYQIDDQQEGKGMGLNIVKTIQERNGGRIEVKSQVGIGTTFILYLKN